MVPKPAFRLNTDPDPDPDPDPGFWWPKIDKNLPLEKKIFFYLQEKPSALKKEHTALQYKKFFCNFFYFCESFLPSCIRIQSGSATLRVIQYFFYRNQCSVFRKNVDIYFYIKTFWIRILFSKACHDHDPDSGDPDLKQWYLLARGTFGGEK